MTWALAAAALAAIVDWRAVAARNRRLEYVAKPAVMVALIAAAMLSDASSATVRTWFVVALAFSLAGDVFLMLEREQFLAGLASFLMGHLAYVAGMVAGGLTVAWLGAGTLVAIAAVATIGRRIGSAVATRDARLTLPVGTYIIVISVMLAAAVGTGNTPAVTGAALFYLSDALLGWNRFVAPLPRGRLAVIVPYHVGQALLVLAIASL